MNNGLTRLMCVAALATITPVLANGQSIYTRVVEKHKTYRNYIRMDTSALMVEVQHFIPRIQYQLYYATPNNFTHTQLYKKGDRTFLRKPVATALQKVAATLAQQGFGIMIWDAYRPYDVSKKMWSIVPDERYVANPVKGSGHNRGIAVDLTLYELATGKELDMGTGFDHFSDSAHHGFVGISSQQQHNRLLLKKAMEDHGFTALQTEWWHYSWQQQSFPLLNLSFRQLARLAN